MNTQLPWIDLMGLGLIGLFAVLGIVRGLWWQVVRLLGVLIAVAIARALSPRWSPWVAEKLPDLSPGLTHGITWFGLFTVTLVAASLLGLVGKKSLEAMQLGLFDRIGGAVAGITTGALVHAALLVALCELSSPEWSQDTIRGTHSQRYLDTLAAKVPLMLDAHAAERLAPWFEGHGSGTEAEEVESADDETPRVR